jgi:hypothetical protein
MVCLRFAAPHERRPHGMPDPVLRIRAFSPTTNEKNTHAVYTRKGSLLKLDSKPRSPFCGLDFGHAMFFRISFAMQS